MIREIGEIMRTLRKKYVLRKYNDFTIAEYFRRQGAEVGDDCRIMVSSLGSSEPYLIRIGNHCTITQNVVLLTHDGGGWVFTEEIPSLQKFGRIEIKDNCFIGINSIILPNVTIGPNSIVGAGSVVTKNVPENVVVAGNPARMICTIEEYKKKITQWWEQQKPTGYLVELRDGVRYAPEYIQACKTRDLLILRRHLSQFYKDNKRSQ